MPDLRIHRSISEVPRQAWDALVDERAAPFLEWTFLDALEQSGSASAETGWQPCHFTVWRDGVLVAAAPAYLKPDSDAEWVEDDFFAAVAERIGVAYFPKLVFAVPFTPATCGRFLVAPGEDRRQAMATILDAALGLAVEVGLSSLHVLFCTGEEAEVLAELGFQSRAGVQCHFLNSTPRPDARPGRGSNSQPESSPASSSGAGQEPAGGGQRGYAGFDEFLDRFTSRRRKQIRRERAALQEQGITLRLLRGAALSAVDPAEVQAIYEATYSKHGESGMLRPGMFPRLLRDFSHRMEWVEARREGKLLAGALCFSSATALYGRYWGCLEEVPFLHFNTALYRPVEECIARGLERFEPGHGGGHKLARGFEPVKVYSAHRMVHPVLERAMRVYVEREAGALAQLMAEWKQQTGLR